jgi:cytidylate kinase
MPRRTLYYFNSRTPTDLLGNSRCDDEVDESEAAMTTQLGNLPLTKLESAEKVLKAAMHLWKQPTGRGAEISPPVFVTVSRQPGAGAISFSHKLAERLNATGPADWSAWDRELVEKVSAEHGIAKDIIEMIPNRHRSWLEDFVLNFSTDRNPPDVVEIRAYKRVAATIRALAAQGHAIIVGLGGTFITQHMPGAIHLRLIAPLDYRIKGTAEREKISIHEAARRVAEIDYRRSEFYRRWWPTKSLAPETFTMTLNSGELSLEELVECVVPLIQLRQTDRKCSCTTHCGNVAKPAAALAVT